MSEEMTPDMEERLKEWEEKAADQQERFDALPEEERAAWGIKPGETLEEKQERDERENPSK